MSIHRGKLLYYLISLFMAAENLAPITLTTLAMRRCVGSALRWKCHVTRTDSVPVLAAVTIGTGRFDSWEERIQIHIVLVPKYQTKIQ